MLAAAQRWSRADELMPFELVQTAILFLRDDRNLPFLHAMIFHPLRGKLTWRQASFICSSVGALMLGIRPHSVGMVAHVTTCRQGVGAGVGLPYPYSKKCPVFGLKSAVSVAPPKADIAERDRHVRFVPEADIRRCAS
jgi:hypothetical protein